MLTYKQATFLWLGRNDLFHRVYEEFTQGDFNVLFPTSRQDPDYEETSPVLNTVPEHLLNKLGFLMQLYLVGLPEWLLVDRDLRRDLSDATVGRIPHTHANRKRKNAYLRTVASHAPTEPWWQYQRADIMRMDFLYLWAMAMRPHFWKNIRDEAARSEVLYKCACGKVSALKTCRVCQVRYLKTELYKAKKLWAPLAKRNRGYVLGSLLPYFYTADEEYLPDIDGYLKYYTSPLTSIDEQGELHILRVLQRNSNVWMRSLSKLTPESLLAMHKPKELNYANVPPVMTSIPVRMYAKFSNLCIQCGTYLPDLSREIDDPDWHDGTVLCETCNPNTSVCVICGMPHAVLGVCLPCVSEATRRQYRTGVTNELKTELISASTGTYRIPLQHYNFKGEFFYDLDEVTLPEFSRCSRCNVETHYTNRGMCYSCRTITWREENAGKDEEVAEC